MTASITGSSLNSSRCNSCAVPTTCAASFSYSANARIRECKTVTSRWRTPWIETLIFRHYKNCDAGRRVSSKTAGPLALGRRESGQVGNEAATAECHRCRGQGSPFPLKAEKRAVGSFEDAEGLCPSWNSSLFFSIVTFPLSPAAQQREIEP